MTFSSQQTTNISADNQKKAHGRHMVLKTYFKRSTTSLIGNIYLFSSIQIFCKAKERRTSEGYYLD